MATDIRFKSLITPAVAGKIALLPFIWSPKSMLCTCRNCAFINRCAHNYCTNCGFPLAVDKDRLTIYQDRLRLRRDLLRRSEETIQFARHTLYIMAALCMLGVAVLLFDTRSGLLTGLILIVVAGLFTGLGRWSIYKPFTSLLISFLILITFIAINTWAEFSRLFTTSYGIYTLIVQVVCFVFLMRGLQAAYRADIMEEEFKI